MAFNLSGLTLQQMMLLRVELNNAIGDIEKEAFNDLMNDKEVEFFKLTKGRNTRVIEDSKGYRKVLEKVFSKQFDDLCITKAILPLTKAEALIKSQFDSTDSKEILSELAVTLGSKTSAPKLEYTGE